jgi:hypothetical protein
LKTLDSETGGSFGYLESLRTVQKQIAKHPNSLILFISAFFQDDFQIVSPPTDTHNWWQIKFKDRHSSLTSYRGFISAAAKTEFSKRGRHAISASF